MVNSIEFRALPTERATRAAKLLTRGPLFKHSSLEKRAFQAWLILIGRAERRETVTYTDLALTMFGKRALRHLGKILGHIVHYCEQHRLPYLNCIVVGKRTGKPGWKVPEYNDKEREKVYRRRWFDVLPPSPEELKTAWKRD